MPSAGDILARKGSRVHTVAPQASVFEALSLLAEYNVGALMVVEDGRLVGVFSERDYARKVVLKGKFSKDTPVREIMTADPVVIGRSTEVPRCMQLMTEKQVRHLPVVDGGTLEGVISIGDVVKILIEDQQDSIQHLERYIKGR
jgi:CBS domain-containing protein